MKSRSGDLEFARLRRRCARRPWDVRLCDGSELTQAQRGLGDPGTLRCYVMLTQRVACYLTAATRRGRNLMKAIVQDKYGSPDVLGLEDIDKPEIGDGDVLMVVLAASAHIGDWHFMTGLPYLFRIAGSGLRAPRARVRGIDVAGRVEAIGKDVTRFQAGDEVFGTCDGAFAEYATARSDTLAPKPVNLTVEQAATVPTSGCTALQAVRNKGKVVPGQKVLIIGAAGGVGSFAVQIAKAFGAHVTGVCSTTKVDLVRSIGADDVIDYTRDDFAQTGERYDVVLDIAGNRSVSHLRRALGPRGTLVIVGGEGGGRWFGGIDRQLRASMLSPFVSQKLGTFVAKANGEDLLVLKELIEAGKVTPVIDKAYPLSEVPEAIRHLEEGHARGKVVITM
jgi:NADPH:quinone reductase-like Zn-dependent oxidoreductase